MSRRGSHLSVVLIISARLFMAALLSAMAVSCGGEEQSLNRDMVQVSLINTGGVAESEARSYKLSIPRSMVRGKEADQTLAFNFLYPEITGLSESNRERFYTAEGVQKDDVVRVFLRHYVGELERKNDGGGEALANIRGRYEKAVSPSDWSDLDLHHQYFVPTGVDPAPVHSLLQADGRILTITCHWETKCIAMTTWHREINVEYFFPRRLSPTQILELDYAIQQLITSFEPKNVNSKDTGR